MGSYIKPVLILTNECATIVVKESSQCTWLVLKCPSQWDWWLSKHPSSAMGPIIMGCPLSNISCAYRHGSAAMSSGKTRRNKLTRRDGMIYRDGMIRHDGGRSVYSRPWSCCRPGECRGHRRASHGGRRTGRGERGWRVRIGGGGWSRWICGTSWVNCWLAVLIKQDCDVLR